jgi:hypothetical protein
MMGNALKLKSMQQQNALAEQQMSDLETARGNTTLLDNAYKKAIKPDGSIDYGVVLSEVALGGKGSLLPQLLKTRAETEDAATKARTSKVELIGKTLDFRRGFLRPDMPVDQLMAWSNGNFKDELLGPELTRMGLAPEKVNADIMAAANSGTLPNYIRQAAQGIEALKLNFVQRDSGGSVETLAMDATGRNAFVVPGSTTQKTLSPDEQSRINREFDPEKVAHVATDENGNIRFFNARGGEVNLGAGRGAGKPSAAVTTARIKNKTLKENIDNTISEFERILKPGGLLDRSTGSGAGAMVDAAAGFAGIATEGGIAIGQLQPIADMSLKLVERFEGPQSDSDRISYKEASANVANASLPIPIRKAAAQIVVNILKKRRDQFGYRDADGSVVSGVTAPSTTGGSNIDALVELHRSK